jgi:hypothetical protein
MRELVLSAACPAAALTFISIGTGCNSVKGSCDHRADDHRCEEILASTIKDKAQSDCSEDPISHVKGTWSTGACDKTNAIAACETNLSRTWFFPGGNYQSPANVASYCSNISGKLLDDKGKALKDVDAAAPGQANDDKLAALVKSMGAPLETHLAAIEKISVPNGASGHIAPSGGKHVTSAHTAIIDEMDLGSTLTDLNGYQSQWPMQDGIKLRTAATAVRKNIMAERDPKKQKEILDWLATLEYLVVVRSPHVDSPQSYNGLNFVGGTAKGDVHVFELPSGHHIGGFSFHAESSKKVAEDEIDSDFRRNFAKALTDDFAKAEHGSSLTFTIPLPEKK